MRAEFVKISADGSRLGFNVVQTGQVLVTESIGGTSASLVYYTNIIRGS